MNSHVNVREGIHEKFMLDRFLYREVLRLFME